MSYSRVRIREGSAAEQINVARELFEEYAAALGIDLGYQGFADELAELAGLLCAAARAAAGCVGGR